MAEGDGAALGVKLFLGHAQLLHAVGSLAGEGLVDLENVDIVNRQAAVLQGGGDGVSGSDAHDLWGDTSDRKADDTAVDAATQSIGHISARQKDARGAVGDLARVSGSGSAVLLEGGLELAEASCGSVGANTVVLVHGHFGLIAIFVLYNCLVWSDLSLEQTSGLGSSCLLVALDGHGVLGGTVDTELSGDVLRRDTHGHEAVVGRLALEDFLTKEVWIDLVGHLRISHRLEATANTDIDLSRANRICNRGDSLQPGRAETVDGSDAGRLWVASHEHGHARISGGRAWVEHVADANVFHKRLVDS